MIRGRFLLVVHHEADPTDVGVLFRDGATTAVHWPDGHIDNAHRKCGQWVTEYGSRLHFVSRRRADAPALPEMEPR